MNSVDRVKELCKTNKIAISRLEKDLGFGNGYISQLKKGTFPSDRLVAIANYLKVSPEYLIGEAEEKSPAPEGDGLDPETIELRDFWGGADKEEREVLLSMARMLKSRRDK